MAAFHYVTRGATALALALASILLSSTGADARATVLRFEFPEPLPEVTSLPECLDDTVGTQTGTEVTSGQVVVTNRTFHVHGTETLDYRVVFADGRYVVGSAVGHFAFSSNSPQSTNTVAIQERRTVYGSAGQVLGTVMIHALSHITFRDANGNFEPDPGEITASVDRFFFTCG